MRNSLLKRQELPKWSNPLKPTVIYKFKKEPVNIPSYWNQYGIMTETHKSASQSLPSEKQPKLSKLFPLEKRPWTWT